MYKFNYIVNEKDYLQFVRYHYKTAPSQKRGTLILRGLAIFVLLVTAVSVLTYGGFGGDRQGLHVSGLFFGCFILFGRALFINLGLKSSVKSMKKDGKAPYGEEIQVEFGENDAHRVSKIGEVRVKYDGLERICEHDGAVYIYIDAIQAFVIPHRVFESEQQKTEFLAFINRKVQKT